MNANSPCLKAALLWLLAVLPMFNSRAADDVEARANAILSQMTLYEKLTYIGGINNMYIRSIPRLGVPEIKMADGPMGTRGSGASTSYPGGIGLAATWNTNLAARYGASLGRDDRARGVHIHLMPGLNMYRAPLCGRNFEYLGEDPFLAARLVAPLVREMQKQGVLATAKHFAANNQEYNRHNISSDMSDRTLREIYLPAFRAAVVEGKAGCVMSAYNPLNRIHCTQNNFLNNIILKGEWGFDGILMSDWGATYDGVAAANGGLDLEMPSGAYMNPTTLTPAIQAGTVSPATIDDKVRRILRSIIRAGFLDRPQLDPTIPPDDPTSTATALDMAREGLVLLKNANQLLPLDRARVRSVAVLGPNAGPDVPAGGGSSLVAPTWVVSAFDGIRAAAGAGIQVTQIAWNTFADAQFEYVDTNGVTRPGLQAEYFANQTLSGTPALRRVDAHINFDWGNGSPGAAIPADHFSARWTGRLRPAASADYLFQIRSDDGLRVYLDGALLLNDWSDHAARTVTTNRSLEGGRTYDLRVEYYENTGLTEARFGWGAAGVPDSVRLADVAVVCVGFNSSSEGEGFDRSFTLPAGQDDFIAAVAAANSNTVVVINAGGSVDMRRWLAQAPAVIQAWYPGQAGGTALGEILFGDVNPSGKLPATFEQRWEDNPTYLSYRSSDGIATRYTEGVFVGYRGFDRNQVEPQFCFGHGLSYTTFEYTNLQLAAALEAGQTGTVSFAVRNTGARAGAEAAQLYVGSLDASVPRPPKELKGFAKLRLDPGESGTVTLPLDESALSFFDELSGRFVAELGTFRVLAGASSRDLRLTGEFDFRLPAPWQTLDIGSVGVGGRVGVSGKAFVLRGSGSDIGGANDAFRFLALPVPGDCQVMARVERLTAGDLAAKAGVMVREDLSAGSRHVFLALTPGNGAGLHYRTTAGGPTTTVPAGALGAPYWVKLARAADQFTGSVSADGTNWTSLGTVSLPGLTAAAWVGMAVTAHNNTTNATAVFDRFTIGSPRLEGKLQDRLLTLSWPAWAVGLSLWSATNLSPPVYWLPATQGAAVTNGQILMTVPVEGVQRFFRLGGP